MAEGQRPRDDVRKDEFERRESGGSKEDGPRDCPGAEEHLNKKS
jgi:hypothetical protein